MHYKHHSCALVDLLYRVLQSFLIHFTKDNGNMSSELVT